MKKLKLGSLFDGSGGFPLAGTIHGIEPVWASEIEPFPIRVTKLRFPNMKHLGSVTDVDGSKVEPVDIITFGSPCQDLSVAGKQAGIHEGQRSNLFFEAIRIIKEMRNGTSDQFPRFAVWENVPGAFSSNRGEDFRAVLQAFAEICEGSGVSVPMPEKGKWLPAGTVVGTGWSLAWRVYDAQFWGVPQRRKRIYLIADFGSERAGEILFKPESLRRHPEKSRETREGTSEDAEGGPGGSDSVGFTNRGYESGNVTETLRAESHNALQCVAINDGAFNESGVGYWMPGFGCLRAEGENRPSRPNHVVVMDGVHCLNPWDCQSKRQYSTDGSFCALHAGENSGSNQQGVCYTCSGKQQSLATSENNANTLGANDYKEPQAVCYALDSTSSNSMKSSNPHSGFHEETVTKTLDTNPDPTCNQGGNVIVEPAAFMGGQGAKARSIAYCDDGSTPTLKSAPSGGNTVPDVVYPINTMVATRGGRDDMRTCFGIGEANDPQFTLSAAHEHGVCYANGCSSEDGGKTCLAFKERAGKPGGGKGILPAAGRAFTLSTNVDQSICYAVEGNTVDRDSKKNGCGYCEGVSPTLNTQDRHAVTYAIEGNGTRESHKGDGYRESDKMYTLNTTEQHAVAYGIDQQGGKGSASYQVDVMPTLCSDSHGTPHAVCFQQNQREEVRDMGEKAGAVTAEPGMHNTNYLCQRNGQPDVVCALASSCVNAEITDGSISPTLMARAGTGGNQLPLLCLNDQGGSMMDVSDKAGCLRAQEHGHQPVVCFEPGIAKRDGSDGRFVEGKSVTLRANAGDNKPAVAFPCEAVGHDMRSTNFGKDGKVDPLTATDWKEPPFVCYGVDCRNGCLDKEKTHTIQAKANGGISVNCTPSVCYPVENHSNDSRVTIRDDDKCQTLTSRMGTGGGNVPMVLEIRDE